MVKMHCMVSRVVVMRPPVQTTLVWDGMDLSTWHRLPLTSHQLVPLSPCAACSLFSSSFFILSCIFTLSGTIPSRGAVIRQPGNESFPKARRVFRYTKLYFPSDLLNENGLFIDTGGLVMMRSCRRGFVDALCSISGWSRKTSPHSPAASTKLVQDWATSLNQLPTSLEKSP